MAEYTYAFSDGLYDTTQMGNPAPINVPDASGYGGTFSLSATNNSVQLLPAGVGDDPNKHTAGADGTFGGKNVVALIWNLTASSGNAVNTARTVRSPDGDDAKIALNAEAIGSKFALVNEDNVAVIYTFAASTMQPELSGPGGDDNFIAGLNVGGATGPNLRRKALLGYA